MKKTIYLAALAALSLTSCSNDSNNIFDESAAVRLENYKKEYANVLTENGGLWVMEYFANSEEPGYIFVMKFDKNGSVNIASNHKWIGGVYQQQVSLWNMIADNGPVLSFNSYNNVFHIFADPANITGTDAPKGDSGDDINETGYGHDGDYEFQVMEVAEDHNTIRLLGKKRLYDIYMRRLDPTTDVEQYLSDYKQLENTVFSKQVPTLLFKDAAGERYVVKSAYTGIMSIYPEAGDAVDQTRSGNFILTTSGIRFMKPLEYVNAAGEEKTFTEFKFSGNYSLVNIEDETETLNSGTFDDVLKLNLCNWKVDLKNLEGDVKDAFDAFNNQLKTLYNYKSAAVNDMSFDYDAAKKTYVARLYIRISAKGYETNKYNVNFGATDGGIKITFGEAIDESSSLALNAYTELQKLFSLLSASALKYSVASDCGPASVKLSTSGGSLTINATK